MVTNGMSEYARDGGNINGGFLVGVGPQDFGSGDPLAGVAFQRRLEEAAYRLGGGNFIAPAQRVEDFLARRPSAGPGTVLPTYRPGVRWTDPAQCLPPFLTEALEEALPRWEGAWRLRRAGCGADSGGEPLVFPGAYPARRRQLPVPHRGPIPLRRGGGLCRRHPVRSGGWAALRGKNSRL